MKKIALALLVACGRGAAVPPPAPPQAAPPPAGSSSLPAPPAFTGPPPPLDIMQLGDVPAKPLVDQACTPPPPQTALHHPGPCAVVLQTDLSETWRTLSTWVSGAVVAETADHWEGPWPPNGDWSEYDRTRTVFTLASDGRRVREDQVYQDVMPSEMDDNQATAHVNQFAYDGTGRLYASTETSWLSQRGRPVNHWVQFDRYFADSSGRMFHISSSDPNANVTNNVWLYPNGVVSRDSTTWSAMCCTGTLQDFYDEKGLIQKTTDDVTDRSGQITHRLTQYNYAAGQLVSVDTDTGVGPWDGGIGSGHTEYLYDPNGNNVERTTTDASGSVTAHWVGMFDTGNNLVCEKGTFGASYFVRHYDYRCF